MIHGTKIGDRIKFLRESRGLTQQALSDALNVTRSSVNMWEIGSRDLKTDTIIALSDFFGVTSDFLLCRTDCSSVDEDLQSACKTTGLSENLVKQFISIRDFDDEYHTSHGSRILPGVSTMLENLFSSGLLLGLYLRLLYHVLYVDLSKETDVSHIFEHLSLELERKKHDNSVPIIDPSLASDFSDYCLHKIMDEILEECKKSAHDIFTSSYSMDFESVMDSISNSFGRSDSNAET